jgi:chromosome segregation ATPase
MQQAERNAMIKVLQKQVAEAQTFLGQAESELATATSDVQTNKGQVEAAREQLNANEKETQAATKQLHEVEAQVLAAQPPDSAYGKAQQQLDDAHLKLDQVIHQVLPELPAHPENATEQDRSTERSRLTLSQKAKLKASAEYTEATKNVAAANDQLSQVRKTALEADPAWTQAHEARQALIADGKTLEGNAKTAGAAYTASQKKFKVLNDRVTSARRMVAEGTQHLAALGAKPEAPAAPAK